MPAPIATTPAHLTTLQAPAPTFLCPLDANTYGIDFLSFNVVSEEASGKKTVVYQSPSAPAQFDVNSLADLNDLRRVSYTFPASFLRASCIRTALEFKIGDQPVSDFRMIELHFYKGKLVRKYDFGFGFCIPNSVNTWEAIYDLPQYKEAEVLDYVSNPGAHVSDSFYFVGDKLIMHNKATYSYAL